MNGYRQNNNFRKQNNNFRKQKPPKNPDPMSNSTTMGREGMKAIRNMAFGRFDLKNENDIKNFRNVDFLKATLREVEKRLTDAATHVVALEYTYANSTDQNVLNLIFRDKKTYDAYNLIRTVLIDIINNINYINLNTDITDIGYLNGLLIHLPNYKYNI